MSGGSAPGERVDAVVVGGRCAGSATAIALAREGRRVVVLEKSKLPSETLSTHVCSSSHVAEIARLGALERVETVEAPRIRWLMTSNGDACLRDPWPSVDGIDYGLCVARGDLDSALAETARAYGADVRERSVVRELVWDDGRVAGVRYEARGEDEEELREIRAPLVVGADGRKSKVAQLVGAAEPYRGSKNGRGFAFWYMDDPKLGTDWREIGVYWYVGRAYSLVVPMAEGRMIVQYIGPVENIQRFRDDREAMWEEWMSENPYLAERVAGAENPVGPRYAEDLPSFFRVSSGPGWALAGDAGHFKDPAIGQGIRDALRFGRLLGEKAAPVLDDPAELDRALAGWEHGRDRECVSSYHWGNLETRVSPAYETLRGHVMDDLARNGGTSMSELVARTRRPEEMFTGRRMSASLGRALLGRDTDRRSLLEFGAEEARTHLAIRIESRRGEFRWRRPHPSEHPGWAWPPRRGRSSSAKEKERAG